MRIERHYQTLFIQLVVLTLLLTSGCVTSVNSGTRTIHTYTMSSMNHQDKFRIDYDRKIFSYYATNSNDRYVANGKIEVIGDILLFAFPANSEYDSMSPFIKSSSKISKIAESDSTEVNISIYDAETGKRVNNGVLVYEVSKSDSTNILKEYPLKTNHLITAFPESKLLFQGRALYHYHFVDIPESGVYDLAVYMQSNKTMGAYETTDKGCFFTIINPELVTRICAREENKITAFTKFNTCDESTNFILN